MDINVALLRYYAKGVSDQIYGMDSLFFTLSCLKLKNTDLNIFYIS